MKDKVKKNLLSFNRMKLGKFDWSELIVRATLSDLEVIQKALDRLNQSPQANTDPNAKP
jgi:hypothetical protein